MSNHIEEAVMNYPLSDENKKSMGILKVIIVQWFEENLNQLL